MDEQLEFVLSSCALINRLPRSQMISNDEQTDIAPKVSEGNSEKSMTSRFLCPRPPLLLCAQPKPSCYAGYRKRSPMTPLLFWFVCLFTNLLMFS